MVREDIYTIEDIYNLPEGERAELIDGQIYYMALPSRKHQKISGEIFASVSEYIRSNKGKCEIYAAPFAVFLDEKSNTYFETFFCYENEWISLKIFLHNVIIGHEKHRKNKKTKN